MGLSGGQLLTVEQKVDDDRAEWPGHHQLRDDTLIDVGGGGGPSGCPEA